MFSFKDGLIDLGEPMMLPKNTYIIKDQNVQLNQSIEIRKHKISHENKIPNSWFLGYPVSFDTVEEESVEIETKFGRADVYLSPVMELKTMQHFGFRDLLVEIGGIGAIVWFFLSNLSVLLVILYMIELVRYISKRSREEFLKVQTP